MTRISHAHPKSCLVYGASSGIGLATALELAARGHALTLVARSPDALEAARLRCLQAGATSVSAVVGDVNDADAVRRASVQAGQREGAVDFVVHTAAVMAYGELHTMPTEVFNDVVSTAINGTIDLARVVLDAYERRGRGVLVVVNSLLGSVTVPGMGAYAASKWGQRAVVRTLQQETGRFRNIHVCIVSPGSINTPIYYQAGNYLGREARPPAPVLQPERAGRVIANLMNHPRRHTSVPIGPTNPVIVLGYRFLPRVYDLIVGPLFRLAALTRHSRDADPGSVHQPQAEQERMHGRWPDIAS